MAEKYSLGLNFQRGVIRCINSLRLLHARDAFTYVVGTGNQENSQWNDQVRVTLHGLPELFISKLETVVEDAIPVLPLSESALLSNQIKKNVQINTFNITRRGSSSSFWALKGL